MDNATLVPASLIKLYDPANDVHNTDDVRPSGNKVDFRQDSDVKPYVTIDIDQEGKPRSSANVVGVRINGNLRTVKLYKKVSDYEDDWEPLIEGPVDVTDKPINIPNEQVGKLKVVPETSTPELEPGHFVFSIDVAICAYGVGKYALGILYIMYLCYT